MDQRAIEASEIVLPEISSLRNCPAIVAIPARNEADRICRCLAALAVQRDRVGAPVEPGAFGVLLLVNNSTDRTAQVAREAAADLPYPLEVMVVSLNQGATAGGARRRAMQEAALRLRASAIMGILLTTDADSAVTPSWFADNMAHLDAGADCVAGYIDAEAVEIVSHGPSFLARGRLEDTYLRLVAEIYARCDPRPHDPWPNHRVSSGASLAVKLSAYEAVGGMPGKALGEDGAFTALLDENGLKVRHALDVTVVTSCRLDGRAAGGAADTMRYRRDVPDAPCDEDLEPALATLRRAVYRGTLRRAHRRDILAEALSKVFGKPVAKLEGCGTFADLWRQVEARHPSLRPGQPLRPSDLPRQIAAARFIVRHLRLDRQETGVRDDRCLRAGSPGLLDASPPDPRTGRSLDLPPEDNRSRPASGRGSSRPDR
jgi:GT2 family glycosyltransferase